MVGTYIAHTCPLEAPNTLDGAIHSIHSLGVEGREERVLEGVVGHRLAQVRVHLAGRREDALHTSGRGRRRQVLLGHFGQRRPRRLLDLPPLEQVKVVLEKVVAS